MNAVVDQKESAIDRLIGLVDTENPFGLPFSEMLPQQLEAINERFKDRIEKIKLLQNRAETGGDHRDPPDGRYRAAAFRAHGLQELSRELAHRAEVGPPGPLARHGLDQPGRADGHARDRRPRQLAAAA